MTQGVDLRSLLERVQKAQGPDRQIEVALFRGLSKVDEAHLNNWCRQNGRTDLTRDRYTDAWAPTYTRSLEAALDLVSELMPLDATDILREAIRVEAKRYDRHIALRPLDLSELARDVIAALLQALITKAEAEEGVGEF